MAEQAGYQSSYKLQHPLGRARWSAADVRDEMRGYVVEHLGDKEATLALEFALADDAARRAKADIPEELEFATKPHLARDMVEAAIEAEVPFAWVTGDEVYGNSPAFRDWLMPRHISFVLAVSCTMRACRKGALREACRGSV